MEVSRQMIIILMFTSLRVMYAVISPFSVSFRSYATTGSQRSIERTMDDSKHTIIVAVHATVGSKIS